MPNRIKITVTILNNTNIDADSANHTDMAITVQEKLDLTIDTQGS